MDLVSDQRRKDAEMKRTKKIEAIQNILNLKKMSLDMLKIKIQSHEMKAFLADVVVGRIKTFKSKQSLLHGKAYMSEIYDPFTTEFTNWLFKHLNDIYSTKFPKEFIEQNIEPACITKLYADLFKCSLERADELLYESTLIMDGN